jgi:hypothetical protein
MTTTTYFKFPDETVARSVLQREGYYVHQEVDTETKQVTPGYYRSADLGWALDVVGTIYEPGTYDDDGNELTPPTPLPGFHINFSGPYASDLSEYQIYPVTPYRKFL